MIVYILLGIAAILAGWMLIDVVIALRQKPIPDLPEKFLDPSGLSLLYHYLTEPENAPDDLVLDEEYMNNCLQPSIEFINGRYDCADFRLQLLFRLYKDCYEELPSGVRELIKKTFLDFKYWMDEPGEDSMCYWSENHQLLFAVSAYLAGQEWPDEIFTNSGMKGAALRERSAQRINIWMEQKFKYGFYEWYSNNYYAENIAPMSNYIQYADDHTAVERMKIIMDLLWFDVATHAVNNTFVAVSSRMYGDNKSSDLYGNRIRAAMQAIWSRVNTKELVTARSPLEKQIMAGGQDVETTVKLVGVDAQTMQNFIAMYRAGYYELPEVIYDIALDPEPVIIKASSGLNVSELVEEGLVGLSDEQIMAQWGSEAFTNPPVIENTLRYLDRHKMFRNKFVNPFRFINIKLLRLLNVPRLLSSGFEMMTNGIALNRGNVYCYRTKYYTLSTAMAYDVDSCGAQAHVWSANIAPDLAVYTTHPARDDDSREKHGASPGYWVGNGRQPMSVQDWNVNITIYRIPTRKRLLEFHLAHITHAYLPREAFDSLEIRDGYVFGRRDKVLLAMIANGSLKYRPFDPYAAALLRQHDEQVKKIPEIQLGEEFDLVREGGEYHTYITELSDTDTESFADFQQRILQNKMEVNEGAVSYTSNGRELYANYEGVFQIDGVDQVVDYPRFASKYATAARKPQIISFEFGAQKWQLDYRSASRKAL